MNQLSTNQPPVSNDHRTRAVVAGHRGDETTARALLADDRADVRASALGALVRMGRAGQSDIEAGLADPDPLVRRRAALVGSRAAFLPADALAPLLDDPDDRVVEVAAFACGERDDVGDSTVATLERIATHHDDSLCREAAVAALGSLGRASSLDVVLAACTDRATVRRRAVLALATFDDPVATDMLRQLTGDRDLQVRQAAEELLAIEEGGEW